MRDWRVLCLKWSGLFLHEFLLPFLSMSFCACYFVFDLACIRWRIKQGRKIFLLYRNTHKHVHVCVYMHIHTYRHTRVRIFPPICLDEKVEALGADVHTRFQQDDVHIYRVGQDSPGVLRGQTGTPTEGFLALLRVWGRVMPWRRNSRVLDFWWGGGSREEVDGQISEDECLSSICV